VVKPDLTGLKDLSGLDPEKPQVTLEWLLTLEQVMAEEIQELENLLR